MYLVEKKLEKRIKRRLRVEVRSSKSLMKEAKRFNPSFLSLRLPSEAGATFFLLAITSLIFAWAHPGTQLFVFALLSTSATFSLVSSLLSNLKTSNELFILSHYPLRDEFYFSLKWRKCVRASLFLLFMSLLCFSWYEIANKGSFLNELGWILLFSSVNWLLSLLMIIILAFRFGNIKFHLAGVAGVFSVIALIFTTGHMPAGFSLDDKPIMWFMPAGIIGKLFIHGVYSGEMLARYLILSGLLSVPAIIFISSRYRSSYKSEDIYESRSIYGENEDDETLEEYVSDMEDAGSSMDKFIAGQSKKSVGWVERTVIRFLDKKEKENGSYAYDEYGRSWSTCWKYGAILMALSLSLMEVYPKWGNVGLVGAVLSFMIGIPVISGSWRCFNSFHWHPGFYQLNLLYPTSYWRMSKFLFKVNLIRLLLWVPVTLASGAFIGWHFKVTWLEGLMLSSEILLMITLLQPVFLSTQFGLLSSNTEITFRHIRKYFFTCVLLLTECLLILCSLILSAYGASGFEHGLILAGILLTGFFSIASWAVNGVFFDRSRADFGVRRNLTG